MKSRSLLSLLLLLLTSWSASARAARSSASARLEARTTAFTTGICRGVMEKSLSPSPSRIQVNVGSPAMSPHSDTGLFTPRATSMICLSERRTAGWSG